MGRVGDAFMYLQLISLVQRLFLGQLKCRWSQIGSSSDTQLWLGICACSLTGSPSVMPSSWTVHKAIDIMVKSKERRKLHHSIDANTYNDVQFWGRWPPGSGPGGPGFGCATDCIQLTEKPFIVACSLWHCMLKLDGWCMMDGHMDYLTHKLITLPCTLACMGLQNICTKL